MTIKSWSARVARAWRLRDGTRNPEDPDPITAILDMDCTPEIASAVRQQPVEGFAFAIGSSMGGISRARRLFADREWAAAELMRMERDMNEAINWAESLRSMIQERKAR